MKGTYLICIFVKKKINLKIGALGNLDFESGHYIYIGSAMADKGPSTLINRVNRHINTPENKTLHWHIDYFLDNKNIIIDRLYLIPYKKKLECIIAKELKSTSNFSIKNFGSSDCNCESHLFFCEDLNFKMNYNLKSILSNK
ncbi:MAG: GIY-YIG nuclease family protein [Candidatus Lokiarchaeota archaeon]|nr:GIY-YIG nuclease family protein [Candidatus Lokiarchaeota archaeon]